MGILLLILGAFVIMGGVQVLWFNLGQRILNFGCGLGPRYAVQAAVVT